MGVADATHRRRDIARPWGYVTRAVNRLGRDDDTEGRPPVPPMMTAIPVMTAMRMVMPPTVTIAVTPAVVSAVLGVNDEILRERGAVDARRLCVRRLGRRPDRQNRNDRDGKH